MVNIYFFCIVKSGLLILLRHSFACSNFIYIMNNYWRSVSEAALENHGILRVRARSMPGTQKSRPNLKCMRHSRNCWVILTSGKRNMIVSPVRIHISTYKNKTL